ncbi:hypothetical protein MMC27_004638, partial [Xylographa pallens]|nr:hypothetical protein [Xylographa pallens]
MPPSSPPAELPSSEFSDPIRGPSRPRARYTSPSPSVEVTNPAPAALPPLTSATTAASSPGLPFTWSLPAGEFIQSFVVPDSYIDYDTDFEVNSFDSASEEDTGLGENTKIENLIRDHAKAPKNQQHRGQRGVKENIYAGI